MKSLFIPAIWIAAVALLLQTGVVAPAGMYVTFAFYAALTAGLLMAWRFHSTRIFFALLVLFLGERAISFFAAGTVAAIAPGTTAVVAVGLLLPLDFVMLSLSQERGFIFSSLAPGALLLFVESVFVAVLCRPNSGAAARHLRHPLTAQALPFAVVIAFACAAIVLLIRFLFYRKPVEGGLLWALAASFLALHYGGAGLAASAYFATAAFILAVSMVETSYLLAYHDELTALPSRRAFHEALLGLEAPYSIAMVDIDHFKRCNDTYGHDTGDEVLRLVASRLARVTGGGQAYRCGGEEFAIIFPGKSTKDVVDHLELLRANIEAASFRLRGQDRRVEARGPDRRKGRGQGRMQTGDKIRQLSRTEEVTKLSVTASMGVATASSRNATAEEVIQAADKALYRAKAGGRNRIETESSSRRRVRSKAASTA